MAQLPGNVVYKMEVSTDIVFDSDEEIEVVNEHNDLVCTLLGQLPSLSDAEQFSAAASGKCNEVHVQGNNTPDECCEPSRLPVDVQNQERNNLSIESELNPADNDVSSDSDSYYEVEREGESDSDSDTIDLTPPCVPSKNYAGDVDHELDFELGYTWDLEDTGPFITKFFDGSQQLLFDIDEDRTPKKFFDEFFDSQMWTTMAEQTNLYARQNIQAQRGISHRLYNSS